MTWPFHRCFAVGLPLVFLCVSSLGRSSEPASAQPRKKTVAGKADVMRHVPKKFATLVEVDADKNRVKLLLEGEHEAKMWNLLPDAELKVHAWWGRLEQFHAGDRVWAWFAVNRQKEPKDVLMLADELSEQDIHNLPHTLTAFDAERGTVTVESKLSGTRHLAVKDLDASELIGAPVYVQTKGESARYVASQKEFLDMRTRQQKWLRNKWRKEGLPGTVTFLHPLSGEMEVMLDHEAIRWGRFLQNGDKVTLLIASPISATVKYVRPWRERTLLRLVTASGTDQSDLSLGQRIRVRVPEPPAEVQRSELPTDIGRLTSKRDRIEWFLASSYCSCKVAGDRCTGMFYSLASCNENSCGMPNQIRSKVEEMIDANLTDKQIWQKLRDQRGPNFSKPHLLH